MKVYATVILDREFGGGEPELTFFPTLAEAAAEAAHAYESVVDGGGSISVHWYDGVAQGVVQQSGPGEWNGPHLVKELR